MVTAASSADAAVVLVDATKLDWKNPALELLQQTRRHSLLVNLLRVPSIVFAVNKLDAVKTRRWPSTTSPRRWPPSPRPRASRSRPPCRCRRSRATTWSTPSPAGAAMKARRCCSCWNTCRPRPPRHRGLFLPGAVGREVLVLVRHLAGPPRVLGPRGHRRRAARPERDHPAQRQDGGGGPGAGPRASPGPSWPATAPASCWTAKSTCRAATGCWPGHLRALARDLGHRRLDGRRAAGRRPRLLGAARPPLGQGQGQAHRAQARRQHAGRGRRQRAAAQCHRPRRAGLQEPLATLPYARSRILGSLVLVDTASHRTSGAALVRFEPAFMRGAPCASHS
jgi:hypothetical protein